MTVIENICEGVTLRKKREKKSENTQSWERSMRNKDLRQSLAGMGISTDASGTNFIDNIDTLCTLR